MLFVLFFFLFFFFLTFFFFFIIIYNFAIFFYFFFQAEDGIRDGTVTGVQTCALPISRRRRQHAQVPDEFTARERDVVVFEVPSHHDELRRAHDVVGAAHLGSELHRRRETTVLRSEERRVGKGWWWRGGRGGGYEEVIV